MGMGYLIMLMLVSIFLEILIMVVRNSIVKIVGFILVVEMENWMNEKIVIVVLKMLDYVVEMEFWIMVKAVKLVQ